MRKYIPLLLIVVVVLLLPSLAFGQEELPPSEDKLNVAQQIFTWVAVVVVGLVGTVATALMLRGNAWLKAKTGVELTTDEQIQVWADHAVALADEKSRALAKRVGQAAGDAVQGIPAAEKLEIAMQFMIDRAKEHQLDKAAESKLRDYVLARLNMNRAGGSLPTARALTVR